jgi:beta-xylosidase
VLRGRDTGRETFLVKVDWEDDWPVFNNGKNIRLQTEGRNGQQLVHQMSWKADLKKESLELELDSRHSIEEGVVVVC